MSPARSSAPDRPIHPADSVQEIGPDVRRGTFPFCRAPIRVPQASRRLSTPQYSAPTSWIARTKPRVAAPVWYRPINTSPSQPGSGTTVTGPIASPTALRIFSTGPFPRLDEKHGQQSPARPPPLPAIEFPSCSPGKDRSPHADDQNEHQCQSQRHANRQKGGFVQLANIPVLSGVMVSPRTASHPGIPGSARDAAGPSYDSGTVQDQQ